MRSVQDCDEFVIDQVRAEIHVARGKHSDMKSRHEAYAVILEELDEVWAEVKRKDCEPAALRDELVQTAAMCIRAVTDLRLCVQPVKS